jgi:hypothetical protein
MSDRSLGARSHAPTKINTSGQLVLLLLEFEDALFNGIKNDEAGNHHRQLLAEPMRTVDRLLFGRGLSSRASYQARTWW